MGGLQDPSRSILGAQQKAYLKDQLSQAQSGGQTWKIIGQQVCGCAPCIAKLWNTTNSSQLALGCVLRSCLCSGMHATRASSMASRCVMLHHLASAAAAELSQGGTSGLIVTCAPAAAQVLFTRNCAYSAATFFQDQWEGCESRPRASFVPYPTGGLRRPCASLQRPASRAPTHGKQLLQAVRF